MGRAFLVANEGLIIARACSYPVCLVSEVTVRASAHLMVLVGLPIVIKALKLVLLTGIGYVGVVQAASLRLEAEDLEHHRSYHVSCPEACQFEL